MRILTNDVDKNVMLLKVARTYCLKETVRDGDSRCNADVDLSSCGSMCPLQENPM